MGRLARFIRFFTEEDDGNGEDWTGLTSVKGTSPLTLLNAIKYKLKSLVQFGKVSVNNGVITCNNGELVPVHESGLPVGYTLLDYIHGNGAAYIDTGANVQSGDSVIVSCEIEETMANEVLWGYRNSGSYSGTAQFYINYNMGNTGGAVRFVVIGVPATAASVGASFLYDFGKLIRFEFNSGSETVRIDGADPSINYSYNNVFVDGESLYHPYLFALNNQGTAAAYATHSKLYDYEVKRNGETIQHFIPCIRESDSTVGMYDLVTGAFFGSETADSFTAGTSVNDPLVIVAVGTAEVVTVTGENLLDADTVMPTLGGTKQSDGSWYIAQSSSFLQKTLWSNDAGVSGSISLTYTYKFNNTSSNGARTKFVFTDGTTTENYVNPTEEYTTVSFTSNSSKTLARIEGTYGLGTVSAWFKDIQVEYGSASPYVPYSAQTVSDIPNLYAVDSLTDEHDIITGKTIRRTEATVYDSSNPPTGRFIGNATDGSVIVQARETVYEDDAVVTFTADGETPLNLVKADFAPVQDLHGQDAPYPAGGGKNKIDVADVTTTGGGYLFNITGLSLPDGTYTLSFTASSEQPYSLAVAGPNGDYFNLSSIRVPYTFTVDGPITGARCYATTAGTFTKFQLEQSATATSFAPYSNECPIDGWTAVDVYDDPAYGGLIRWNQLAVNGNFSAKQSWEIYQCDYTVADNEATVRTSNGKTQGSIFKDYAFPVGHKIFVEVTAKCVDCESVKFQCNNPYMDVSYSGTEYQTISRILTNNNATSRIQLRVASADSTPVDGMFKNFMVCDLTAMFGAGNEPATVADFKALFPADYYPYNVGIVTTVSAVNGDEYLHIPVQFRTNTINQWDGETESGRINTQTGEPSATTPGKRSKNFIPVSPSTTYYVYSGGNINVFVLEYAEDGTFIRYVDWFKNGTYTTGATAHKIKFYTTVDSDYDKISINYPSTETGYHSYLTTVYGGYLRINRDGSADLVGTMAKRLLNDASKWNSTSGTINCNYGESFSDRQFYSTSVVGVICSVSKIKTSLDADESIIGRWSGAQSDRFGFKVDESTITLDSIKAMATNGDIEICYVLAEPVIYHLPSIQALKSYIGKNNIWHSANGKSTVALADTDVIEQNTPHPITLTEGTNTVEWTAEVDGKEMEVEYRVGE